MRLSRSLEQTGRELYHHTCESLKEDAAAGRVTPRRLLAADRDGWPPPARELFESATANRFAHGGNPGDRLNYFVRHGDEIWGYSTSLHGIGMSELAAQFAHARALVAGQTRAICAAASPTHFSPAGRHLAGGVLALSTWRIASASPIQKLDHADSRKSPPATWNIASQPGRDDEIGTAIACLQPHGRTSCKHSRERLVYVTRLESWQALARKMAHESQEFAHADPADHGGDRGPAIRSRAAVSSSRPRRSSSTKY